MEWKIIEGCNELYEVSDEGQIRNRKRNHILKQKMNDFGYMVLSLVTENGKKTFFVHRLVADAFLTRPDGKTQINHKDQNKTNNCVGNLEWVTARENSNYGDRIERIQDKRKNNPRFHRPIVCVETGIVYHNPNRASEEIDPINKAVLYRCLNGQGETYAGYHWRYI